MFGRDPAGEAHDAPIVGWGGAYRLPILYLLDAYGVRRLVLSPMLQNVTLNHC